MSRRSSYSNYSADYTNQNEIAPDKTVEACDCESSKVRDGGCRAWLVCMATIYTFGLYLGFEFNYGLIYTQFIREYNSTKHSVIYAGSLSILLDLIMHSNF
jgi:hypothetical protein